jgi:membrane protein YqaA with SNARE-associated domain
MTVGDVVGYILGRSMSSTVLETQQGKKITRIVSSHPRYIMAGVFLYAMVVPLPNELIVMPLAALGISWQKILIPILIGNAIFSTVLAFGATQILQLFV